MLRNVIQRLCLTENRILLIRNKNTAAVTKEFDLDEIENTIEIIEDSQENEEEIEKKRNKSRLTPAHYNILHNKVPYVDQQYTDHHRTVKYHRKLYGVYGAVSGVDPKICWPTTKDIQEVQEYERIKYPHTIQKMMQSIAEKKRHEEEQRRKRQEDVKMKFAKLEQWKQDLKEKVAKKEAEALAIKERKDRLVEEVRRHFGFKIDPRDERFKEMLEQKEKAQKKAMKEAKRKIKEAKIMARLQENKMSETTNPIEDNTDTSKTKT